MSKVAAKSFGFLKEKNSVLSSAVAGTAWVRNHQSRLVMALILLAMLVVGVLAANSWINKQEEQASQLFLQGLATLDAVVQNLGEPSETSEKKTYTSEQEKWQAAQKQFLEITEKYKMTDVSSLAKFMIADLHEKMNGPEKAEPLFRDLTKELSAKDPFYFVAVERLAYLLEKRGEVKPASDLLSRLNKQKNAFYGDYAAYEQARLLIAQGQTGAARTILENFSKDYPKSSLGTAPADLLSTMPPVAPSAEKPVSTK